MIRILPGVLGAFLANFIIPFMPENGIIEKPSDISDGSGKQQIDDDFLNDHYNHKGNQYFFSQ